MLGSTEIEKDLRVVMGKEVIHSTEVSTFLNFQERYDTQLIILKVLQTLLSFGVPGANSSVILLI